MSCLYTLEINPLLVALFADIFSHSVGCLFILFMVSFAVQKLLRLIRSHLFIFVFIFITLGGGSEKILLRFMSESLTFRCLSILSLLLCFVLENVIISFVYVYYPVLPALLTEETVFSPLYILASFVID